MANHPKILPTWHCLKFPHDLQHFFLPKTPPKNPIGFGKPPEIGEFWKTPNIGLENPQHFLVFFSLSPPGEFELKRDYLVGSPGRSEL